MPVSLAAPRLRRTPDKDKLVVLDFVADVRRLAEII
jgi:hypothetical protein